MGPIVKLEVAKMHKPLVLKCFRVLLKTFPKPLLWLSVKLDNIGRLETFKAAICAPHCHSSAVLMVILVTMCPGVCCHYSYNCVTPGTDAVTWGISQANYWTHTKWSQWGNIQTRQNIWSTLHIWLQQPTMWVSEKTAGKPDVATLTEILLQFRSLTQAVFITFQLISTSSSLIHGVWEDMTELISLIKLSRFVVYHEISYRKNFQVVKIFLGQDSFCGSKYK